MNDSSFEARAERLVSSPDERGRHLEVAFHRDGDRFYHRIYQCQDDTRTLWLASVEQGDHADWPPSPPLQQISVESQPAGAVALLVGMAGRSHWSLSVEALAGELRFDVACRAADPPGHLGSRYQVSPQFPPDAAVCELGQSRHEAGVLDIVPQESAPGQIRWAYRLVAS